MHEFFCIFLILLLGETQKYNPSCNGNCGSSSGDDCYCDDVCSCFNDCCSDMLQYCYTGGCNDNRTGAYTHSLKIKTADVESAGSVGPFTVLLNGHYVSSTVNVGTHLYSSVGGWARMSITDDNLQITGVNLIALTDDSWSIDGVWVDYYAFYLPSDVITLASGDLNECNKTEQFCGESIWLTRGSCSQGCEDQNGCYCDAICHCFEDCCTDKLEYCPSIDTDGCDYSYYSDYYDYGLGSCSQGCGYQGTCFCDELCCQYEDCCADKENYCPGCLSNDYHDYYPYSYNHYYDYDYSYNSYDYYTYPHDYDYSDSYYSYDYDYSYSYYFHDYYYGSAGSGFESYGSGSGSGSGNSAEPCSRLACSNFCGNGTRSGYIGGQWCWESCNLGDCGYYVVEKDSPYERCQNETHGTYWNDLGWWDSADECQEACTWNPHCNYFSYNINNTRCTSFQSCELQTSKKSYLFEIQAKMLEGTTLASKLVYGLECLKLNTVNESSYIWPIWVDNGTRHHHLIFNASSDGDLYLALGKTTETDAPHFEIKIAGDNKSSEIRDLDGSILGSWARSYGEGLANSWHSYWILWETSDLMGFITVGLGDQLNANMVMWGSFLGNYSINVIGLSNTGTSASWVFGCENEDGAIIKWWALLCCMTATNVHSSSFSIETVFGLPIGSVAVASYFIATGGSRRRDENSQFWNVYYEITTDFYSSSDIVDCLSNSDCLIKILDQMESDLGIALYSLTTVSLSTHFIDQNDEENAICINDSITKIGVDNLVSHARNGTQPCMSDADCSGNSVGASESCNNFVCSITTTL